MNLEVKLNLVSLMKKCYTEWSTLFVYSMNPSVYRAGGHGRGQLQEKTIALRAFGHLHELSIHERRALIGRFLLLILILGEVSFKCVIFDLL